VKPSRKLLAGRPQSTNSPVDTQKNLTCVFFPIFSITGKTRTFYHPAIKLNDVDKSVTDEKLDDFRKKANERETVF
jgi:hypothetical protein